MDFLEDIKEQLRPDTSVMVEIELFIKEVNKEIREGRIKAKCVSGGSIAKGTFLKKDYDVDLFVKFDYSYKDKDISKLLGKILKKFNAVLLHGSRDYFQLRQGSLNYEIVPVLDIRDPEKALNVTDMSPLHVDWVRKNLKESQYDEVRLAKKFCKSIGAYGAESHIQGFSGHVIDILIVHYGSFLKLLRASRKWKPKVTIDYEKHYRSPADVSFNINKSKTAGPMIIVDPILKTRNASSALSLEKFSLFKRKAEAFLKKPSEEFFAEKIIDKVHLRKKHKKNLIILTLKTGKGKPDVIGSKVLKSFKFLKKGLKQKGFGIKKSGWHWDKGSRALAWFVLKDMKLPEKMTVEGPPLEMEKACREFKKKYKNCFKKNKRLYAEIKVKKRGIEANIRELSGDDYFKGKVRLESMEKYI